MSLLPVVKRLEERLHILGGNREYIENDQMGILKMKTLMPEIKITWEAEARLHLGYF